MSSYLQGIPTEDLLEELNKRKQEDIPKLVKTIENAIGTIKKFGIKFVNDCDLDYTIDHLEYDEEESTVRYIEV